MNPSHGGREDKHLRIGRIGLLAGIALLAVKSFALNPDSLDWKVGGFFDAGRFQIHDSGKNERDGELLNRLGAEWKLNYRIDDNWSLNADLLWTFWRNQMFDKALFHVVAIKFDADMRGLLQYESGPSLAKLGVYDFKYNPDSKNLGEYLLRSIAYPTIIESSQGKNLMQYSYTHIAGVEYGLNYDLFRAKALLYAEQFNMPVYDVTPVLLAAAGPKHAELEAGLAYDRFWMFGKRVVSKGVDSSLASYIERQGLSRKAVKLMLRGRIDFAKMLGHENNDYLPVLYAEAALLGLKNDSLFYKKTSERMPIMAGIDLPTFGLLSVLSAEVEYLNNPYYDRRYPLTDNGQSRNSPLPWLGNSLSDYDPKNFPNTKDNNLRWSIFAKRSLNPFLDVEGRVASDHLRLVEWNGEYHGGEPYTTNTKDWYFLVRINYHN